MSTTKAAGLDKVTVRPFKHFVNEIIDSLTSIINLSFETATRTSVRLLSDVSLIFKSRDKSAQINYRPISVLPVISKICERHVHVTFLSWLQKFRLLIESQPAYLKNHSWVTSSYWHYWQATLLNMDRGDINDLLMLNRSKIYAKSETTLDWFNSDSYLWMRKQALAVNGTTYAFFWYLI